MKIWIGMCLAAVGIAQTPCERLGNLKLPDTTITAAATVAAGPARGTVLPAYCRVAAVLTPSADSHIEMELWMPVADWNGKFEAVGNGGWAGSINFAGMAAALRESYATASTDTGHKSSETPGGSFALGHPEKLIDYGYRAIHEMTVKSKAIIAAFYATELKLSYWNGCSNGGRQGLMEAQRYPDDFGGIVAGAPAANWTGRASQSMAVAQASHQEEGSLIPPAKFAMVHSAVMQACDKLDGVVDGILQDPVRCQFNPAVLQCKGGDGPDCLTAGQVETARKIYMRLEPGSEAGWATYGGAKPFGIGEDHFKYVVFRNPSWDFRTLNADADATLAEKIDGGTINALNPDLRAFFAKGGKLIQYHGWSDPQIAPMHSVKYYESVLKAMGGAAKVGDSYRMFMVPAMGHCSGGPGPDQFNAMGALERWREGGAAPDQIVAAHVSNNKVDMTRPLCPYPQVAEYKGKGSTSDAGNFVCRVPKMK